MSGNIKIGHADGILRQANEVAELHTKLNRATTEMQYAEKLQLQILVNIAESLLRIAMALEGR